MEVNFLHNHICTLLTFHGKNYDCAHLNIEKLTSLEISQNHLENEASHTTGLFNRVFDNYMCMSVCRFVYGKPIQNICMPKCVGGITWPKHAHAQSQLKPTCDTCIIHFYIVYAKAAFAWMKKKPKNVNYK